jgi:hypothetical protein
MKIKHHGKQVHIPQTIVILRQAISAKRDVSNEEGANARSNKTRSKLSYKFFNSLNKSESTDVSDLQVKLVETDAS